MKRCSVFTFCLFGMFLGYSQVGLLKNSDFSDSLKNWNVQGNVIYSQFFGVHSIAFSDANSVVNGVVSQNVLSVKNEAHTLKIEFTRRGTPIGKVQALVEVFDSTTANILLKDTLKATSVGVFQSSTLYFESKSKSFKIQLTDLTTNSIGRDFYVKSITLNLVKALPSPFLHFGVVADDEVTRFNYQLPFNCTSVVLQASEDTEGWKQISTELIGTQEYICSNLEYENIVYFRLKYMVEDNQDIFYSDIEFVNIDSDELKLDFYPNPVLDFLILNADFDQIVIHNVRGIEISKYENIKKHTLIDTKNYEKGVFYLSFKSKNKYRTTRFMKT